MSHKGSDGLQAAASNQAAEKQTPLSASSVGDIGAYYPLVFHADGGLNLPPEGYWVVTPHPSSALKYVRFYPETITHIAEEHPEIPSSLLQLPSVLRSILSAVEKPTSVYESRSPAGNSLVFASTECRYEDRALYVPVRRITENSARVATAYYSSSEYKGALIWGASNDR